MVVNQLNNDNSNRNVQKYIKDVTTDCLTRRCYFGYNWQLWILQNKTETIMTRRPESKRKQKTPSNNPVARKQKKTWEWTGVRIFLSFTQLFFLWKCYWFSKTTITRTVTYRNRYKMSQYIFFQAADIFDWSGGGGFFGMIQEQYGPEDQSVSRNEKKNQQKLWW